MIWRDYRGSILCRQMCVGEVSDYIAPNAAFFFFLNGINQNTCSECFPCSNASNYFISVRNQHPQWDHLLNYTNDVAAKKGAKTFDIPFLMLGFWTLFEVRYSTIKTEFNWLNFPIKHNIESHFPSKFMITLFNLHVTFRRANEEYKWSTFSLWLISKCKYSVWFLDKISHFTDTFFVDIFIG